MNQNKQGEQQWNRQVWLESLNRNPFMQYSPQSVANDMEAVRGRSEAMTDLYVDANRLDEERAGRSAARQNNTVVGAQPFDGDRIAWQAFLADYSRRTGGRAYVGSRYGGSPMGSVQRNAQDQARSARVAQERMQQEPDAPVRSMSDELNARTAALTRPSSIADSGFGGSRATSAAQAEGGGGGSFNKYAAMLQAVRAGYPDVWSMMTGDKTPRLAFGQNREAQKRVNREVVRFAKEIERRWKEYLANGGQLDMAGFINKYDYPQNREAYIEQRAREDNVARGVRAGQR